MQTLGEEYCDILQVTGQSLVPTLIVSDSLTALLTVLQVSKDQQDVMLLCVQDCIDAKYDGKLSRCPRTSFLNCAPTFSGSIGLPPGTVRRGFLVLLQTMMPYLADQIGTSAERTTTHTASWASQSQLTDQISAAQPHFASTGKPAFSLLPVTCVFTCLTLHSCLILKYQMVSVVRRSMSLQQRDQTDHQVCICNVQMRNLCTSPPGQFPSIASCRKLLEDGAASGKCYHNTQELQCACILRCSTSMACIITGQSVQQVSCVFKQ